MWRMPKLRFYPLGLRLHALIVSFSLLLLTGILGFRAYSVAKEHFSETHKLLSYDLKAQTLLERLEQLSGQKEQAQRKFRATQDPLYSEVIQHHEESIAQTAESLSERLRPAYPNLAGEALKISTLEEIRKLKGELDSRRDQKLQQAGQRALGLIQVIGIALVITVSITTWVVYLFYQGLMNPLAKLRWATARIRGGDFSHRLKFHAGVAELQELAQSFNQMAERLDALDRAKADFLATISHEIKNPLAALKEGLNLLASQGDQLSPAGRNKAFSACLISAKRLEWMINNLLNLSRGEKGIYDLDLEVNDLGSAIQTAIDEVRPLAEKRGMSFQFDNPGALLAPFNWNGMVQVFSNLFLNAIKYGSENTVIEVQAHQPLAPTTTPSEIAISVSNMGREIPEAENARIFDRFFRASNATKQQGLGIGLHVVKNIIEAHRGKISAQSDAGRTEMRIIIPQGATQ